MEPLLPGSGAGPSMAAEGLRPRGLRLLLDENHPPWLGTRPGLCRLRDALIALADEVPAGLGEHPVVWWLDHPRPGT